MVETPSIDQNHHLCFVSTPCFIPKSHHSCCGSVLWQPFKCSRGKGDKAPPKKVDQLLAELGSYIWAVTPSILSRISLAPLSHMDQHNMSVFLHDSYGKQAALHQILPQSLKNMKKMPLKQNFVGQKYGNDTKTGSSPYLCRKILSHPGSSSV